MIKLEDSSVMDKDDVEELKYELEHAEMQLEEKLTVTTWIMVVEVMEKWMELLE